jgi:calcineurin-like phosphoesterase family protein
LRVFTQEQEQELIEKWNSVVGKDDIVYYNGDFCDGNFRNLCNYFTQLNGQIVLIRGNHDRFSDGIYKAVFKDVVDEVVLKDLDLTIHHVPTAPSHTSREVFGHLHRDLAQPLSSSTSFCSCVQFSDGYPVSLEKILLCFK